MRSGGCVDILCSARDGWCRQIKEKRGAAEAETLSGGRTRRMLETTEGITKQRHQREKTERGWRNSSRERERRKEREGRESDKGNTVRVMCVGVVLHVYEPEA